jgi:PAS domain S-box-containing protein
MNLKTFQNPSKTENLRAGEFFHEQQVGVYKRTDRIFSVLLPVQWLAAIVAANILTPLTWNGSQSYIHPRIGIAIIVGGIITVFPLYLTIVHQGKTSTRYVVGICQMLMSGVLIHITGGRIETHFHIFGSLAFLACYRDWRVLIPATLVTAADHYFRGWLDPFSIYGISAGTEWRWVELTGWVVFTDIFLIVSCLRSVKEMWKVANRNALLNASEERYRTVIEQMTESIFFLEPESLRVIECNEAFVKLIGCQNLEEAKTLTAFDFEPGNIQQIKQMMAALHDQENSLKTVRRFLRRDGSSIYVEITGRFISYKKTNAFCVNACDITQRRQAEIELKRLALVAEKTQNAVIISDPKGNIQWANEGFTRLTGYEFTEVAGKKPGNFLQGEKTNVETIFAIREAIAKRKPFEGELYNYRKDGKGYWLSLSIMPINIYRG